MSFWSRVVNVFRGDRLSREIEEELQSHFEEAMQAGRDRGEARRAFGSALHQKRAKPRYQADAVARFAARGCRSSAGANS